MIDNRAHRRIPNNDLIREDSVHRVVKGRQQEASARRAGTADTLRDAREPQLRDRAVVVLYVHHQSAVCRAPRR